MLTMGQTVFTAVESDYYETKITCTDCLGQRALTVILGDGSQVSIACQGCDGGYLGSTGKMIVRTYEAHVTSGAITAIEMRDGRLWYSVAGRLADYVYETVEEAQARVAEMIAAHEAAVAAAPAQKVRKTRNWAWHVTYHRRQIVEAERSIKYHTAALAVAKVKAHTPDEAR